ncbi:MAG: SOS response-associated peptidase [Bacteroidetes bacterium]|nr:SOS response-associated peptidase [Bacteroidota bacterium]
MCGRFSFSPNEIIIEERFDLEIEEGTYKPRYNCAPSQNLAVISNADPGKLSFYRWGLIPFWAQDMSIGNRMINAKAETILEKTSFKNPFRHKRCLVPGDGFYEWKKESSGKTPYRIVTKDHGLFAMAGIWDSWKDTEGRIINSFAIITTAANVIMKPIHERMPVILLPEHEKEWLYRQDNYALQQLLKPYPSRLMEAYQVSKLVNSPLNDSPEVIIGV